MIPIANPEISDAAKHAVGDVLDSGMIADGDVVREFETAFAEYVGVEHAIATSSGTTALHTMLEAAGIGSTDAVLTSPFSFVASANAVVHADGTPAFADINPETYNLSPHAVRDVLDRRDGITALMPVHLYGLPAAMDEMRSIADEYDLQLFEDAAQAHGATFDGDQVGALGDAGAFSFYPTKNMTTAEGGMITTDDDEIAARARQLINHGRTDTYEHAFVGYNFRMTNVQAAIGLEQLSRLPDWVEARQENARRLTSGLSETALVTPTMPEDRTHAFHQYTVRTTERERMKTVLDDAGIGYGIYYPKPIPEQPAYGHEERYPEASRASETAISLPVHPNVDPTDVDHIVEVLSREIGA
ncbi:DegT/DnrJ/EryC1/StrS family aminotransferase [Haloarchaeobius baliensis]|uniref:DegT/DnrJ/EryC1/StrS family aminotransferase n=1 Tax=Haloarchaeobius baliensis TaxID=1670458 RepID=UPI003F884F42